MPSLLATQSPGKRDYPSFRSVLSGAVHLHAVALVLAVATSTQAQMGGGQNLPAFEDPSFRDKLWEAGGPAFRDARSGKMIVDVQVEGNQTVSEHKVLSHMQSRPDRLYDPEQLNQDTRELYRTELFDKIETFVDEVPEGVRLRVRVREKPSVRSVVYHGNTRIEDSTLKKHAGIDQGDPISPVAVEQARQRLLTYYQDQGFGHADVQIANGNRPGDRDVIFRISEGNKERIWDIRIVGNQAFSEAVLKTRIKSKDARNGATPYFFNIADRGQIEEDRKELERYYRRLGYFDARVDFGLKYDDSGKWLSINFVVSEGDRYTVGEITFQGHRFYTSEDLAAGMKLKSGDFFNQDRMDFDARLIRQVYGARGFIFVDVTPVPIYLPGRRVNLVYEIEEGDVYRASQINVHIAGENFTKERVVFNQMGNLYEGGIIDQRKVDDAERRLRFSELFVNNPADGEPPRIEILPQVDEDSEQE
jgi:outer membrane protein insertion porin family